MKLKLDIRDLTGLESRRDRTKIANDAVKQNLYGKALRDRVDQPVNRYQRRAFKKIKAKLGKIDD